MLSEHTPRRHAIVTGASRRRGIGAAVCRTLAQAGVDIFFTHWSPYDRRMPWGAEDAEPSYVLTLAVEVAPRGITVNAVDPGPTDTGWMTEEVKRELLPRFPMGRIGQPEDAARLIALPKSTERPVDHGRLARNASAQSAPARLHLLRISCWRRDPLSSTTSPNQPGGEGLGSELVWIFTELSAILVMPTSLLRTIVLVLFKEAYFYTGWLLITARCAIRG